MPRAIPFPSLLSPSFDPSLRALAASISPWEKAPKIQLGRLREPGLILKVESNRNVESKIKVLEPKDPFCGVHIDALHGWLFSYFSTVLASCDGSAVFRYSVLPVYYLLSFDALSVIAVY
jgi:hypothetical protein